MTEPAITINGHALTIGQAMAVRVAITDFHGSIMGHPEMLGEDEHGMAMAAAYVARLSEVLKMILP